MNTWLLEFQFNKVALEDPITSDICIKDVGKELQEVLGNCDLVFESKGNLTSEGFTQLYQNAKCTVLVQGKPTGFLTLDIHNMQDDGLKITEEEIEILRGNILKIERIFQRRALELKSLPPIKRGKKFSVYDTTTYNALVEYDFDEVVFEQNSKYQNIRIMHSPQYGNCVFLDNDLRFGFNKQLDPITVDLISGVYSICVHSMHYHKPSVCVLDLAESDIAYTLAITGGETTDYRDKEVLILGGGDGGILHHLRKKGPKMITMIEIDDVVIDAARKYLRGICGDSLDEIQGNNYKVIVGDCVKYLKEFIAENRKFDYVINDLTAIPISTTAVGSHWDFLRQILSLSMMVLKEDGTYFNQGNGLNSSSALEMYEKQLEKLECPVSFTKEIVCVPSYLELWVFYKIWKHANNAT